MYVGFKVSFEFEGVLKLGYVESETIEDGRLVMVVERDGVRTRYRRDEMENFNFFEVTKRREYTGTGEPFDAVRDRYNTRYGYGAWKSRRRYR